LLRVADASIMPDIVSANLNATVAVAKIVDDADVLLEFYKYPAEHWIHLRTTNPIESTFATVRLRTKVTKAPDDPLLRGLPWSTS
jgi:transposase-like protein